MHTVEHRTSEQRFVITLPAGDAELSYTLGQNWVDFNHTYVPPEMRGRGLAEKLVQEGLSWAHREHLQVRASCSYVAKYRMRHNSE